MSSVRKRSCRNSCACRKRPGPAGQAPGVRPNLHSIRFTHQLPTLDRWDDRDENGVWRLALRKPGQERWWERKRALEKRRTKEGKGLGYAFQSADTDDPLL